MEGGGQEGLAGVLLEAPRAGSCGSRQEHAECSPQMSTQHEGARAASHARVPIGWGCPWAAGSLNFCYRLVLGLRRTLMGEHSTAECRCGQAYPGSGNGRTRWGRALQELSKLTPPGTSALMPTVLTLLKLPSSHPWMPSLSFLSKFHSSLKMQAGATSFVKPPWPCDLLPLTSYYSSVMRPSDSLPMSRK